jgi:hypothetical protein
LLPAKEKKTGLHCKMQSKPGKIYLVFRKFWKILVKTAILNWRIELPTVIGKGSEKSDLRIRKSGCQMAMFKLVLEKA